jgi:hypothetical protein
MSTFMAEWDLNGRANVRTVGDSERPGSRGHRNRLKGTTASLL